MINKVAIVQAHREAYPGLFQNSAMSRIEAIEETPITLERVDTETGEVLDAAPPTTEDATTRQEVPPTYHRTFPHVDAMLAAAREIGWTDAEVCSKLGVATPGKLSTTTQWGAEFAQLMEERV